MLYYKPSVRFVNEIIIVNIFFDPHKSLHIVALKFLLFLYFVKKCDWLNLQYLSETIKHN